MNPEGEHSVASLAVRRPHTPGWRPPVPDKTLRTTDPPPPYPRRWKRSPAVDCYSADRRLNASYLNKIHPIFDSTPYCRRFQIMSRPRPTCPILQACEGICDSRLCVGPDQQFQLLKFFSGPPGRSWPLFVSGL